jgi:transposase
VPDCVIAVTVCSACSKRCALCQVTTHGHDDDYVQFHGRLATCRRCGHTAERDTQAAASIFAGARELVATGERPAYLCPEDTDAWQWRVSEVKAGRY